MPTRPNTSTIIPSMNPNLSDSALSSTESGSDNDADAPPTSPPFPSLREISPLASWTVSTYKPGCGVPALLNPSTGSFWQSDGPQPHLLNIHFFKLVHIVKMRIYLDFELDESYTPTKMVFAAGMGEYDLVEFAEWKGDGPRGWVDVGLGGCGGDGGGSGGEGEGVLRCMCVQVRVLENHQNGKDTHIRGVQIFAREDKFTGRGMAGKEGGEGAGEVHEVEELEYEDLELR